MPSRPRPRTPILFVRIGPSCSFGTERYHHIECRIMHYPETPSDRYERTDPGFYDWPHHDAYTRAPLYWPGFSITAQTDNEALGGEDADRARAWYARTFGYDFRGTHTVSTPEELKAMQRTTTTIAHKLERYDEQIPNFRQTVGEWIARIYTAIGADLALVNLPGRDGAELVAGARRLAVTLDNYTDEQRRKLRPKE